MDNDKNRRKQLPLRISAQLYVELERWAEDDFRSLNGQIEYLLTRCVQYRKKGKSAPSAPIPGGEEFDGKSEA